MYESKDVWRPLHLLQLLLWAAQFGLMGHLNLGDPASASQNGSTLLSMIRGIPSTIYALTTLGTAKACTILVPHMMIK